MYLSVSLVAGQKIQSLPMLVKYCKHSLSCLPLLHELCDVVSGRNNREQQKNDRIRNQPFCEGINLFRILSPIAEVSLTTSFS